MLHLANMALGLAVVVCLCVFLTWAAQAVTGRLRRRRR